MELKCIEDSVILDYPFELMKYSINDIVEEHAKQLYAKSVNAEHSIPMWYTMIVDSPVCKKWLCDKLPKFIEEMKEQTSKYESDCDSLLSVVRKVPYTAIDFIHMIDDMNEDRKRLFMKKMCRVVMGNMGITTFESFCEPGEEVLFDLIEEYGLMDR